MIFQLTKLLVFSCFVVQGAAQFGCNVPSSLSCAQQTISCASGKAIAIRSATYYRKPGSAGCPSGGGDLCPQKATCCTFGGSDRSEGPVEQAVLDQIVQECTAKESCTFNIPYTNTAAHYIFYNFNCIDKAQVLSLMCEDTVATSWRAYMFYHGVQRSDTKAVTCSCEIRGENADLRLHSQFINLHQGSCPSFASNLAGLNLGTCNAQGLQQQYKYLGKVNVPLTLNVNSLAAKATDIFWLRFEGKRTEVLTVSCTGCGINVAGACGRTEHTFNGCYGAANCNKHAITCKAGQVIGIKSSPFKASKFNSAPCGTMTCNAVPSCCTFEPNDIREFLAGDELKGIHKACDQQETCEFSPDLSNPGTNTLAQYVYDCIPGTSVINMMVGGSLSGYSEAFIVYKGTDRAASTSTSCSCDVTTASGQIDVYVYNLALHPDSCCQLKITSGGISLPAGCTEMDGASTFTQHLTSPSPIKFKLDKMIARTDDSVFIRFANGNGVDISCGSCTEQSIVEDATTLCEYPKNETTTVQPLPVPTAASTGGNGGGDQSTEDTDIIAIAAGTVGGVMVAGLLFFAFRKFSRSKKTDPLNF